MTLNLTQAQQDTMCRVLYEALTRFYADPAHIAEFEREKNIAPDAGAEREKANDYRGNETKKNDRQGIVVGR